MGVSRVFRLGTPYNGVELSEIDTEQQTDTMYLAHIDHPVGKLTRAAHDSWSLGNVTFGPAIAAPSAVNATAYIYNTDSENDGNAYYPRPARYTVTAVDADGLESRANAPDSAINDLDLKRNRNIITWGAVAGAESYNVYKADNSQFLGYIGKTEATTFTDDNIGPDLSQAPPEAYNPFDGVGNYPSTVTFFEQRLFLGRTRNSPNAIWGSRSAEFENFDQSTPLRADDSIAIAANAGRVNAINQLVATTSLLALASENLFRIDSGGSDGGYLTATPPATPRRQIGRGSSRLSPIVVDNVVFYTPSVGSSVRSINYKFEIDGLTSDDVSIFSPHFFEGMSIVSWCYAQEPRSIIWAVRSDGKLLAFTWEQAQQVWGWTLCETDGFVLSCCSVPENGEDRVYLTVRRGLPGGERTFIERMASTRWESVEDCCYLDCAVSYSFDQPQSTFRNLWHLEGREVWGLVDGFVVKGLTVTNGAVTLPPSTGSARKATFGIPFDVDIQTMPVMFNGGGGSNAARKQQPGELVLHLKDSRNVLAGAGKENGDVPNQLFELKTRGDEPWGTVDTLKNGKYLMDSPNVVSGQASVYVKQTDPLPLTLLGVYLDPIVNG
ncbi:hypothetical protein AI27_02025 [Sphingomonas sp. BHC-A]|nr:hypothetical protein AI27_02025 [Sphingomonas sp. BHC-A]